MAEYSQLDPVVNIFRTLGQLYRIAVSGEVAVMPEARFSEALVSKSSAMSSDLVLVPWGDGGSHSQGLAPTYSPEAASSKLVSSYSNLIKPMLDGTEHNVAIFFPKAMAAVATDGSQTPQRSRLLRAYSFRDIQHDIPTIPVATVSHHIFLPYFGGSDDELALMLVLQLCEKPGISATVVHFSAAATTTSAFTRARDENSNARVKFETVSLSSSGALEAVRERAEAEIRPESRDVAWHNLVVLGRSVDISPVGGAMPQNKVAEEVRDGLGDMAAHLVAARLRADVLVIRARVRRSMS